jgi:hypothetical protein
MNSATGQQSSHSNPITELWQGWSRFWFKPADPTTLGLIRILGGFLIVYVHLCYSFDLQTFFGKDSWINLDRTLWFREKLPWGAESSTHWEDDPKVMRQDRKRPQSDREYYKRWGLYPDQVAGFGQVTWSIWFHVTNPVLMWIIHGALLLCMFCFAIGFCTRVMGVITWAGLLCYINRSMQSLFGMDTILIVVGLYLMIGPSGAALSVDRLLKHYWAVRRARRQGRPEPAYEPPQPSVSANVALRLLQIHACIIYGMSGFSKLEGPIWWRGMATWYTMANYEFSPLRVGIYMHFLRYLAQHRWLWELVMVGGTYGTLVFEIGFPFLVWRPRLRWVMLGSAVLMHLGIAICMGLVTFSMMMLILVLSFVPAEHVKGVLGRIGRGVQGIGQPGLPVLLGQDIELAGAGSQKLRR